VVECLDGLHFSFGPASFQQVNLQVFEKILQESLHMSPWISWPFHGNFMGIYGCHVVAPHSIHALAAIGFRLRKLRKLPEL
jgi:hypothetical protein